MGTQLDIFRLLCLILLIANSKGGCGCGNQANPLVDDEDDCSCFGSINTLVLAILLLSTCNCGGNGGII